MKDEDIKLLNDVIKTSSLPSKQREALKTFLITKRAKKQALTIIERDCLKKMKDKYELQDKFLTQTPAISRKLKRVA